MNPDTAYAKNSFPSQLNPTLSGFSPLTADVLASILHSVKELGAQELIIEPLESGGFRLKTIPKSRPLAVNDAQLAKLLGVTKFLVADWAKKGIIASVKEGNTRFFLLPILAQDLARLLDLGRLTADRKTIEALILDWLLKSNDFLGNEN